MKRVVIDYPYHCETGCSLGKILWSGPFVRSPGVNMSQVPELRFVYVTKGICQFKDDRGYQRELIAGDMMILLPNLRFEYHAAPRNEWDEHYIACNGPLIDMWINDGLVTAADPVWRLLPVGYWVNRMIAVIGDVVTPDPDESLAQLGRLQVFLSDMRQARRSGAAYPDERLWLNQARKLLEAKEGEVRPSLKAAADEMECGYNTFRRRFTQLAGIGPAQYRLQSQVHLASALIMDHPMVGNKTLADRCGFSDEYHFSKQFKRIVGLSPKQYRVQAIRLRQDASQ
jgi:AraC-like DNA-binding protein